VICLSGFPLAHRWAEQAAEKKRLRGLVNPTDKSFELRSEFRNVSMQFTTRALHLAAEVPQLNQRL